MGWNKGSDNVLLKIVRFALLKVGGIGTVYSVEGDGSNDIYTTEAHKGLPYHT